MQMLSRPHSACPIGAFFSKGSAIWGAVIQIEAKEEPGRREESFRCCALVSLCVCLCVCVYMSDFVCVCASLEGPRFQDKVNIHIS
jgi:hypothetical protein